MFTGKDAFRVEVENGLLKGQCLAIFDAYCSMHDAYPENKDGFTVTEVMMYIKYSRPDIASLFKQLGHINKYHSKLRRFGVLREGPSRVCKVIGGTRPVKTHKITGMKSVALPSSKTLSSQLKEIREQLLYMDAIYSFGDRDVNANFALLKKLAGVK